MIAPTLLVLSGPPKAGKSRLRGELYQALLSEEGRARLHGLRLRWFVQAFSPDSEGQWVNDAHALGRGSEAEGAARRLKSVLKESGAFFSPQWIDAARRQLEGLCRWADVVVADLGGLPSAENRAIVEAVWPRGPRVMAVVLTRDGDDAGWVAFWRQLGISPWYVGPYREGLAQRFAAEAVGPYPVGDPGESEAVMTLRGAVLYHLRLAGAEGAFDAPIFSRHAAELARRVAREELAAHPGVIYSRAATVAWEMIRSWLRA